MKIDLEQVDRNAREALNDDLEWDPGHRLVIALCDRIRELEDALRGVLDQWERAESVDLSIEREILQKGTVLP
jgi:hypothetical protein